MRFNVGRSTLYNMLAEEFFPQIHVVIWDFLCVITKTGQFKTPSLMWASLVAQRVKHLPAMWETWVPSLGQEDPLEKEMVTHSSILAWRIPWTEEPGRLQTTGLQRVRHDSATSLSFFHSCGRCWSATSIMLAQNGWGWLEELSCSFSWC